MRFLARLVIVSASYMVAVLASLAALVMLFGLASLLPEAPGYWKLSAVVPAVVAAAPVVGAFLIVLAVVLCVVPMLLLLGLAEALSLRSAYVYVVSGAVLSAVVYLRLSPHTIGGLDETGALEAAIFALSGACAGLIYWAIAGRRAGSWRRPE